MSKRGWTGTLAPWPKTLFGRIALILFSGLAAAHVLTFGLLLYDRAQALSASAVRAGQHVIRDRSCHLPVPLAGLPGSWPSYTAGTAFSDRTELTLCSFVITLDNRLRTAHTG